MMETRSAAPRSLRRCCALALCGLGLIPEVLSSQSSQPEQPRFGASAVGVLVDVTVRDSEGRPLTCLTESQFEILEDGIPQQLVSLDRIGMGGCEPEGAAAPRRAGDAVREALASPPTVTALVFEELGADGRAAAWQAASAFVTEQRPDNEFVGVFYIDRAVHTLAPYTANREEILRGLRKAAMRPGCPIEAPREIAGAEFPSRCNRGMPIETLRGLRGIVGSLSALPGRKNILLFSEGFFVNSDTNEIEAFHRIVDDANAATITFQSIDAAGLRVGSPTTDARRALRSYAGGAEDMLATDRRGGKLDANAILSMDPTAPLEMVARATGGEFIASTNDLVGGVRRVGSEMRAYYRLTYVPSRQTGDEGFRRLTVKVNVPGAVAHTRSGYSARRVASTVSPPELAPHLLLDGAQLPGELEMDVAATHDGKSVRVLASVSAKALTLETGAAEGSFEGAVTILARLLSKKNRMLASASETFALSGPSAQLDQARTRTLRLEKTLAAAEAETLEVVAYDVLSGRAGAARLKVKSLPRQ